MFGKNVAFCHPKFKVLLLTFCSQIDSRWRDLSEAPSDTSAPDNQSLDSGAEGPEEPDNLDLGKSKGARPHPELPATAI